jgi:hypothetical protein
MEARLKAEQERIDKEEDEERAAEIQPCRPLEDFVQRH